MCVWPETALLRGIEVPIPALLTASISSAGPALLRALAMPRDLTGTIESDRPYPTGTTEGPVQYLDMANTHFYPLLAKNDRVLPIIGILLSFPLFLAILCSLLVGYPKRSARAIRTSWAKTLIIRDNNDPPEILIYYLLFI